MLAAVVAAGSAAGAQVDPPTGSPAVAVWSDSCIPPGGSDLVVYGRGWAPGPVELSLGAAGTGSATAASGVFQTRVAVSVLAQAPLKLTASQGASTAEHTINVSFSCTLVLTASAAGACTAPGQAVPVDLNVRGVPSPDFNLVAHHVDLFGPAETIDRSQPARPDGSYSLTIQAKSVPSRLVPVTVEAREAAGGFKYATTNVKLPPECRPGTTTTAPPPTAAPPTQPTVTPTTLPVTGLTPLPPLLAQPRPAGVPALPSLSLSPSLGQAGQATTVTGTGFAPSATVTLRWRPGIGEWTVQAGGDGSFRTQVLVLPKDVEGPRTLQATGNVAATASYLVVPASDQPAFGGVFLRG